MREILKDLPSYSIFFHNQDWPVSPTPSITGKKQELQQNISRRKNKSHLGFFWIGGGSAIFKSEKYKSQWKP